MRLLKAYDTLDPSVVQTAHGPHPIAADYYGCLAELLSHGRKVPGWSHCFFKPGHGFRDQADLGGESYPLRHR